MISLNHDTGIYIVSPEDLDIIIGNIIQARDSKYKCFICIIIILNKGEE